MSQIHAQVNIFLERIMTDALEDHEGTVGIGGRTITISALLMTSLAQQKRKKNWQHQLIVSTKSTQPSAHGMETSAKKTKLMTHNSSGINTEIKVNGQKLETFTSFKQLGLVITDEGSKPEILSRIAKATAALTRLKPVQIDKSISRSSKIQLMCSLVTSIFLYDCESWTPQQSSKEEYKPWK